VRTLKRFWQGLESLPSLAAVEAEWVALLGSEHDLIKPFLRPRRARATSYPRLDGRGLPYEVVQHDRDDLVGVCRETGETITLTQGQLVVYELDQQRLAKQVARALGVGAADRIGTSGTRLFHLGAVRPAGYKLAAFLFLAGDSAALATGVATLISCCSRRRVDS
jgi:hypothetical protein